MSVKPTVDKKKHLINYLRLSLTDRCNLRCVYCMPSEGIKFMPHSEVLSYEEILYIVQLAVTTGIRKIRLTGGEPLVRKDIISFLQRLNKIDGLEEITLTTNGVLLNQFAAEIKACGIKRINVSMDSLKPERFFHITKRDYFEQVWEGIREAERLGFDPIKINVVAIKGFNDDEILDFARLTIDKPYHIRFIEFMPVGEGIGWSYQKFISIDDIYTKIKTLGNLKPVKSKDLDGPAQRFILEGGKGEIGFIGALSNHFCDKCNRMRLTAEGRLRGCLFSDNEIDIKTPLREGRSDSYLFKLFRLAGENKPKNPELMDPKRRKCIRNMSSIGG